MSVDAPRIELQDEESGVTVLALGGEIDLAVASELREALHRALDSSRAVLVDLCDCTFMDSTVLGALLAGARRAAARNVSVAIACLPDGVPSPRCSRPLRRSRTLKPDPARS